jgi:AraC-like DNA-binding protein
MLEAREPKAFARRPEGGFVAGTSWFYFAAEGLYGYAIWGRPEPADIRKLVHLLVRELERPPHEALVDLEHLEVVNPESFEAIARYTVEHAEGLARVVERTAIVVPRARVNAAIVAGFFDVSSRPFPVTFCASVREALGHLGRGPGLSDALAAVRAQLSGEPDVLRELRAHLAANVASPSLDDAARAIGLSMRTLQRRLADAGTSFETQVQHVRVATARRMLEETDVPVTTIALEVGFQTAQHFSTSFKQRTGETPTSYRARARRMAR